MAGPQRVCTTATETLWDGGRCGVAAGRVCIVTLKALRIHAIGSASGLVKFASDWCIGYRRYWVAGGWKVDRTGFRVCAGPEQHPPDGAKADIALGDLPLLPFCWQILWNSAANVERVPAE